MLLMSRKHDTKILNPNFYDMREIEMSQKFIDFMRDIECRVIGELKVED